MKKQLQYHKDVYIVTDDDGNEWGATIEYNDAFNCNDGWEITPLDGPYKEYYQNGKVLKEVCFNNNLLEGSYKELIEKIEEFLDDDSE